MIILARPIRFLALIGLAACANVETPQPPDESSFGVLKSQVLAQNCAVSGCHVGPNATAAGGLSLSGDDAYANLINATPTQLNAKQDGLKRIRPGFPDSSLFYLKLISPPSTAHDYGNTMPQSAQPLSAGQLAFVQQWILQGAPRTTIVASTALLSDKTPQSSAVFTPLVPPAAGTGYQLKVDPFVVNPSFERELFVYRAFSNPSAVYVRRVEFKMRPGSHHFVMYNFNSSIPSSVMPQPNVVRDIRRPDGTIDLAAIQPMAYHVFFAGSMQTQFAYDFPAGVGLRMPANSGLDLNLHYANRTPVSITGEAYANVYTVDSATLQHIAKSLNLSNTGISLPAGARTTLEKTFLMTQPTTVFALSSHMHKLGERFQIRIVGGARDGELVYESTDWEHPQMLMLTTPIVLQAGDGLKSTVTWNNTTSQVVNFGLLSTDEMGIIFGYYY